jgi:hypothetical protein
MGPIDSPETSVLNQPTPRNNTEDGRTYLSRIYYGNRKLVIISYSLK